MDRQKLRPLVGSRIFEERLEDIRSYERYLGRNGTAIIKFFLNVSKDEQKRRFLERIDNPEKHWKFALGDIEERKHWSAYMAAYEDAIRETATQDAPWYVVPADKKWFTRLVVAGAIIERLAQLGLEYPQQRGHPAADGGGAQGAAVGTLSLALTPPRCEARTPRMRRAVVPVACCSWRRNSSRLSWIEAITGPVGMPMPTSAASESCRLASIVSGTASLTPSDRDGARDRRRGRETIISSGLRPRATAMMSSISPRARS